jgi:Tol biopolymer transport system component/DNA-binding winged helix-turn-helix (wHTH) protein
MAAASENPQNWRFGAFEVEGRTAELRRNGVAIRLQEQPSQLLLYLLQHAGEIVTREDLRAQLWPADTFVDFDHALNTAVMKLREALGDSSEKPLYIQTLPRKGYRFVAPVSALPATNGRSTASQTEEPAAEETIPSSTNGNPQGTISADTTPKRVRIEPPQAANGTSADLATQPVRPEEKSRPGANRALTILAACSLALLLALTGWFARRKWQSNAPAQPVQRALTRLTSDEGLQTGATWSPDGRFIAYSSDRGGKYDIWIQQISGGDPIQITKGPGQNWMPDWSPDGKYIAYRSEEGEGGIYITPALGGQGQQRKIASFGYYPQWSPDSSRILFLPGYGYLGKDAYVVGLDGSAPREVLTNHRPDVFAMFATWHPDGRRLTASIFDSVRDNIGPESPIPHFSTEPVDGGHAIESRFAPELQKQIEAVAGPPGAIEWRGDFRFAWAPSGKAIYFERTFHGARNVWRMTVDPVTLQIAQIERLTTSPGLDTELSVSPDGSKLAFTSERQHVSAWAFPFDANHGRVTGAGQPVTSAGIEAWSLSLSRDGRKLAVLGNHDGQQGTWEMLVPKGHEQPLVACDSYNRSYPVWSPDGKRAAYGRGQTGADKNQVVVWSSDHRSEDPVQAGNFAFAFVFDWSPDGKSVLVARWNTVTDQPSIWQFYVDPPPTGKSPAREITSDPKHELFQPHFSPDGRWIVFEAVKDLLNSTLYAVPAAGGPWIRITDGKQWDDKPRWSPDGKTIYYLSERRGFFNVWGIRFDPVKGKPFGEPFQVTSLESPTLMIPKQISAVEFSLSDGRLVLPLAQASGNIWILDNVDR